MQQEVAELSAEINRIAADTSYGGQHILSGEHDYMVRQESSMGDSFITVRPMIIFPMTSDHAVRG